MVVVFKCNLRAHFTNWLMDISFEIALVWMPQNTFDDGSTYVQVMIWCRRAISQCWSTSYRSIASLGRYELCISWSTVFSKMQTKSCTLTVRSSLNSTLQILSLFGGAPLSNDIRNPRAQLGTFPHYHNFGKEFSSCYLPGILTSMKRNPKAYRMI